jgi:hypothetical protein
MVSRDTDFLTVKYQLYNTQMLGEGVLPEGGGSSGGPERLSRATRGWRHNSASAVLHPCSTRSGNLDARPGSDGCCLRARQRCSGSGRVTPTKGLRLPGHGAAKQQVCGKVE